MTNDYSRQLDLFNPDHNPRLVTIVGCGSVGSFTALALAKMGVNILGIYDGDRVEEHNLPNQFFREKDLNRDKASALAGIIKEFTGKTVMPIGFVNASTNLSGHIVILAVDTMQARRLIWERVKASGAAYYIDSRMGGNIFSVFTIDMSKADERDYYEKTLVDDRQTLQLRCTERSIIYNVLGVASVICRQVVNAMTRQEYPIELHFDYANFDAIKLGKVVKCKMK